MILLDGPTGSRTRAAPSPSPTLSALLLLRLPVPGGSRSPFVNRRTGLLLVLASVYLGPCLYLARGCVDILALTDDASDQPLSVIT